MDTDMTDALARQGTPDAAYYRDRLVNVLDRLDNFDVDGAVACFADDAELIIESDGLSVRGIEEIRAAVQVMCDEHEVFDHELTNVVVDVSARKIASEQRYRGVLRSGKENDMLNCNFLDFDDAGRITRLISWHAASHR